VGQPAGPGRLIPAPASAIASPSWRSRRPPPLRAAWPASTATQLSSRQPALRPNSRVQACTKRVASRTLPAAKAPASPRPVTEHPPAEVAEVAKMLLPMTTKPPCRRAPRSGLSAVPQCAVSVAVPGQIARWRPRPKGAVDLALRTCGQGAGRQDEVIVTNQLRPLTGSPPAARLRRAAAKLNRES